MNDAEGEGREYDALALPRDSVMADYKSPAYLLAALFAARKSGDVPLQQLHLRRLARLGIRVQFASDLPPKKNRNGVRS